MTGHKNVISTNYLKLVKHAQRIDEIYTRIFTIKSPTFSTVFLFQLFTYLQPVLGQLLPPLIHWCFSSSSVAGILFQAQFIPTQFFFIVMCCLLDSFAVLFGRVDTCLLKIILQKIYVCIPCIFSVTIIYAAWRQMLLISCSELILNDTHSFQISGDIFQTFLLQFLMCLSMFCFLQSPSNYTKWEVNASIAVILFLEF